MTVRAVVILFAAVALAAGDVVRTGNEVIQCEIVNADSSTVRLKVPSGGIRMLWAKDVQEITVTDQKKADWLALVLPSTVTLDVRLDVNADSAAAEAAAAAGREQASAQPGTRPHSATASALIRAGDSFRVEASSWLDKYFGACLGEGISAVPAGALGVVVAYASAGGLYGSGLNAGGWVATSAAAGTILSLGSAAGVCRRGERGGETGSFWAASAGAMGGTLAGVLVGLAVYAASSRGYGFPAIVLTTPAGAVIGYNLSRPKEGGRHSFNDRLGLPGLAVRQERLPDGAELTVYDARLVTVRF